MKALLYAEGGNLDHLFETKNKIYHIIAENWIRSEKIMVRTDVNHNRPPSPIKFFKKLPNMVLNSESTIESIHENSATVTIQELKYLISKKQLLEHLKERLKEQEKPNKIVNLVSNIRNRQSSSAKSSKKKSKR